VCTYIWSGRQISLYNGIVFSLKKEIFAKPWVQSPGVQEKMEVLSFAT
jgi:hypothetical protein